MKATRKNPDYSSRGCSITRHSNKLWIAYYRVSTRRQGLGIDAQRARVQTAAKEAGATIIAEYEEKESGKECNRPQLNRAMAEARRHGATVVVAKHDRLSRDLSFAADLVFKSSVSFLILNIPQEAMTDPLLFGVYFGLAAREAQMISERTAAALAALKAKGVKLGRPDAATSITPQMRAAAAEVNRRKASENSNNIASINEIRRYLTLHTDRRERTLQSIANHLTECGFYTSRGIFHSAKSVDLLCKRFAVER